MERNEMDQTLQHLINERDRWEALERTLSRELAALPAGCLCFKTIRGKKRPYRQVYVEGVQRQKSISGQETLIAELARKSAILRSLPAVKSNVKALSRCIEKYRPCQAASVAEWLPEEYRKLCCAPFTKFLRPEVEAWLVAPENSNPYYPEYITKSTHRGDLVRSKSEGVIADLLYAAGLPYKYEACCVVNGQEYYPDFTIMHPINGKLYYWEHFGLTGDEDYMAKADRKIVAYRRAGIVQWDNLIVTYDDPRGSIDVLMVQRIINVYFK